MEELVADTAMNKAASDFRSRLTLHSLRAWGRRGLLEQEKN